MLYRNIILVTGGFATGKSRAIDEIRRVSVERGIPVRPGVIADGMFLLDALGRDHGEHGGSHHIHPGKTDPNGHTHDAGEELMADFVVTHSLIQQMMFADFFEALSRAPLSEGVVIAELAGGVSRKEAEGRDSPVDYSYESIVGRLADQKYETLWIPRVLAVWHLSTESFAVRAALNSERGGVRLTDDAVRIGEKSWQLPDEVMDYTYKDDFRFMSEYLDSHGLGNRIHHLENSGGPDFFESLKGETVGVIGELTYEGRHPANHEL